MYSHQPVEVLRVCIPQMSICQQTTGKRDLGTPWCQHLPKSENAQTSFDQREQLKTSQHSFPSRKGTHSYRSEFKTRSKELLRSNSKILKILSAASFTVPWSFRVNTVSKAAFQADCQGREFGGNKEESQEIVSSTVRHRYSCVTVPSLNHYRFGKATIFPPYITCPV